MSKALSLLLIAVLHAAASDTNSSLKISEETYENNVTLMVPQELNASRSKEAVFDTASEEKKVCLQCTAAHMNGSDADEGFNWFFYRNVVNGMDTLQHYLSHKVTIFSSNLDYSFAGPGGVKKSDEMPQQIAEYANEQKSKESYAASRGFGAFFKDETYLDATNRSYVRLRGGYEYDQRGGNRFLNSIAVRIKLPRTKDRFQLFIGGESEETGVLSDNGIENDNSDIGIKYFLPTVYELLNASTSVGLAGIDNPYVRGSISYPFFIRAWLFRPVQKAKYSAENEFEEWTTFFFDYKTSNDDMLRFLLQRSTRSSVNGMNYMVQASYFNTQSRGVGLNRYISINGRTKDLDDPYTNGKIPQEGVYSYAVGAVWKQRLGRDYLYYQLQPVVDFHEQYDYKANAIFKVTVELYFGNY